MFFFGNIYITMIVWTLVLSWISFWALVFSSRREMIKSQKRLDDSGVIPKNTMRQHGMCINAERGIGVKSNQRTHNNTWFRFSD